MTRNQTILTVLICILGIVGIFISSWWGGLLSGIAFWSLFIMFIGKKVAAKAARKIDKNIRDIIVDKT